MPDEEKNFPATPRRRLEARKKGQVARSPEFSAAVTLLAMVVALHALLPSGAGQSLLQDMREAFAFNPRQSEFSMASVFQWQRLALTWLAPIVVPTMALAVVLGVAVNVGQVGFSVTPEALAPKWDRVNPMSGIKRLLSMHGLESLVKGIVKLGLIGDVCYTTLRGAVDSGEFLRTMQMALPEILGTYGALLWTLGLRVSVALFLIAAADYAYQRYDFEKNLRMSASEIKQEMKSQEGDPKIKAKIRQIQREMAKRRMMEKVPKADVVVTNPTHYAIALQYAAGSSAPTVVAKGADYLALRIKEIAREHNVPTVENRPLAQTLYATVEIDGEIPGHLYEAVAKVLAYVYKTHGRRPAGLARRLARRPATR